MLLPIGATKSFLRRLHSRDTQDAILGDKRLDRLIFSNPTTAVFAAVPLRPITDKPIRSVPFPIRCQALELQLKDLHFGIVNLEPVSGDFLAAILDQIINGTRKRIVILNYRPQSSIVLQQPQLTFTAPAISRAIAAKLAQDINDLSVVPDYFFAFDSPLIGSLSK